MDVKGVPFTSLELNLHCLVIASEGNNVFFSSECSLKGLFQGS